MPRLGAHLSIGGGLPRAVERAVVSGCETLQIFTKSAGQWRARPLPDEEIRRFRQLVRASGIRPVFAHNSYLINIAANDAQLRRQSLEALWEEIERAESLGLDGLIMHPGSYTSGTESAGLQLIAEGISELLARRRGNTMILLEHTAGQDITRERGYRDTFRQLDALVGLDRVKVFHVNDSKKPCGSRVDRHEHIGQGCLGLETFRRLLNDRRFKNAPMLLETPKDDERERRRSTSAALEIDPYDAMNLATLRSLLKSAPRQK